MIKENMKPKYMMNVIAMTEVFPDGQKIIAVVLEFEKEINNSKLNKTTFSVFERTITKVYSNYSPGRSQKGVDGKYVIIELSPEDKEASTIVEVKNENKVEVFRKEIKIGINQLEDIITTDGEKYKPDFNEVVNDGEINLITDDFLKLEFNDLKSGERLKYHLFRPEGYDSKKSSYPLVVFLHDRGVCSEGENLGLIQGLGGVIWASDYEQAKHEAFVLIPQYPIAIVNDNFEATKHLDITVDLINSIVNHYNIDSNRIYGTGQSMGCMALTEMGIRYPNMFAALLLVAGQWDPRKISILAENKMWILVSEGDTRAYKGMNACMASLELAGAKISRLKWNGRLKGNEAELYVKQAIEEGKDIKYTIYENGTIVPEREQEGHPMFLNHMYTWRSVYKVEGLRDWLFTQKKS